MIVPQLGPIIQAIAANKKKYVEPFGGGLNMYTSIRHPDKQAYDINPHLVALINGVAAGRSLPDLYDAELYHAARVDRADPVAFDDFTIGAFGFLATYAGRWFAGFSVRLGGRDYVRERVSNLDRQLAGVPRPLNFEVSAYQDIPVTSDTCYYLDPPYAGTTGYRDAFEFGPFLAWARDLASDPSNVVLLSGYEVPEGASVLAAIPKRVALSKQVEARRTTTEFLVAL